MKKNDRATRAEHSFSMPPKHRGQVVPAAQQTTTPAQSLDVKSVPDDGLTSSIGAIEWLLVGVLTAFGASLRFKVKLITRNKNIINNPSLVDRTLASPEMLCLMRHTLPRLAKPICHLFWTHSSRTQQFSSWYNSGHYFVDIHPPLGKLIHASVLWALGWEGAREYMPLWWTKNGFVGTKDFEVSSQKSYI